MVTSSNAVDASDAGSAGGIADGARVLAHAEVKTIRMAFVVVIVALGVEMIYNGMTGRL